MENPAKSGFFCGKNMKTLEIEKTFTPEEQETIAYYRKLLAGKEAYIGNRPFLSRSAQVFLMLEGLSPFKGSVLEELGSVWGFYNTDRKDVDLNSLAKQLGIKSGILNHKRVKPGQKFEIYTMALVLCFSEEGLKGGDKV